MARHESSKGASTSRVIEMLFISLANVGARLPIGSNKIIIQLINFINQI